jgi:hypothetical protein
MSQSSRFGAALAVAAAALLSIVGCSEEDTGPDELTPHALAAIVLSVADFGALYSDLVLDPRSGIVTNDAAVASTPAEHQWVLQTANDEDLRSTGYSRVYKAGGPAETGQPLAVTSHVEVFANANAATAAFIKRRDDPVTFEGFLGYGSASFVRRDKLNLGPLGDGWFGEVTLIRSPREAGALTTWSRVIVRHDTAVARATIVMSGEAGRGEPAIELAGILDRRLAAALRGDLEDGGLSAEDVLVLAQSELSRLTTTRFRSSQEVETDGAVEGRVYDLALEFPGRALGTFQRGNGLPVQLYRNQIDTFVLTQPGSGASAGAGDWRCLESFGLETASYGLVVPDFTADVRLVEVAEDLRGGGVERIDGHDVHRLRFQVDLGTYFGGVASYLGSTGPYPAGTPVFASKPVEVEMQVSAQTLMLESYLVDLSYTTLEGAEVTVRSEVSLSDFDEPISFPAAADLPDCRGFDAPCSGRNLDGCLETRPELLPPAVSADACRDDSGPRVCLVPLLAGEQPVVVAAAALGPHCPEHVVGIGHHEVAVALDQGDRGAEAVAQAVDLVI